MLKESVHDANRGYFLESGRVMFSGTAEGIIKDERIRTIYLGLENGGEDG